MQENLAVKKEELKDSDVSSASDNGSKVADVSNGSNTNQNSLGDDSASEDTIVSRFDLKQKLGDFLAKIGVSFNDFENDPNGLEGIYKRVKNYLLQNDDELRNIKSDVKLQELKKVEKKLAKNFNLKEEELRNKRIDEIIDYIKNKYYPGTNREETAFNRPYYDIEAEESNPSIVQANGITGAKELKEEESSAFIDSDSDIFLEENKEETENGSSSMQNNSLSYKNGKNGKNGNGNKNLPSNGNNGNNGKNGNNASKNLSSHGNHHLNPNESDKESSFATKEDKEITNFSEGKSFEALDPQYNSEKQLNLLKAEYQSALQNWQRDKDQLLQLQTEIENLKKEKEKLEQEELNKYKSEVETYKEKLLSKSIQEKVYESVKKQNTIFHPNHFNSLIFPLLKNDLAQRYYFEFDELGEARIRSKFTNEIGDIDKETYNYLNRNNLLAKNNITRWYLEQSIKAEVVGPPEEEYPNKGANGIVEAQRNLMRMKKLQS
jgi:hypothetical protein